MRQLLFLLLFPCLALAQYQGNANQKITLGEQTTADGLVFRGVASIDTVTATSKITRANKQDTSAYLLLDTVTNLLWHYKIGSNAWTQAGGGVSVTSFSAGTTGLTPSTATTGAVTLGGTLAVANGGTGSATQNFVDLTTTQSSIGGAKTFTSAVTGARFDPTANTVTGNGMYLPAINSLGFSTAGTQRIHINSAGKVGIATQMTTANNFCTFNVAGNITFETDFFALRANGSIDDYAQFLLRESGTSGNFGTGETGQLEFLTYSTNNNIGALAIGTYQSRPVIFGTNNLERVRVTGGGKMQIAGTTDRGTYNLQVNGTGVWGEGAYFNGSDANIKENIVDLDSSLNIVNNLKPVIFNYINTSVNNDTKHLGFIAQDVYQTLENKDYLNSIVRSDGDTLSIAYSNLIPLLTKAIQEQQALIKALEQRILTLENK